MPQDTRIALFLMGELVAALRANDSDAFRAYRLSVFKSWEDRGRGIAVGLA